MSESFEAAVAALRTLQRSIETSVPGKTELVDQHGWVGPVLTGNQLAERASDLADRIERVPEEQQTDEYQGWLENVPSKIDKFRSNTLPNLNSGNAPAVCSLLEQLCVWIEGRLPPENWPVQWQAAANAGQIPQKLAQRLRALEAKLNELEPRTGSLDEQISRIEDANSAAESLPTDLASLHEARAQVSSIVADVGRFATEAERNHLSIEKSMIVLEERSTEATTLMANIDDTYRATTSKGLADAFAHRAYWLQVQTWIWVGFLMISLVAGGAISYFRVARFEALVDEGKLANPALLWVNVALAFVGLAAPVWFAWMATKQITQRFKLAEDYGFKAAVAKAYEGYRREAASIDPLFTMRLFGSALTRLEEAPLRLVDEENYGSPFHELTASSGFREALALVPSLGEKYVSLLKKIGGGLKSEKATEAPASSTTALSEEGGSDE